MFAYLCVLLGECVFVFGCLDFDCVCLVRFGLVSLVCFFFVLLLSFVVFGRVDLVVFAFDWFCLVMFGLVWVGLACHGLGRTGLDWI